MSRLGRFPGPPPDYVKFQLEVGGRGKLIVTSLLRAVCPDNKSEWGRDPLHSARLSDPLKKSGGSTGDKSMHDLCTHFLQDLLDNDQLKLFRAGLALVMTQLCHRNGTCCTAEESVDQLHLLSITQIIATAQS